MLASAGESEEQQAQAFNKCIRNYPEVVSDIEAFVICQASDKLDSCSGLGVRSSGRPVVRNGIKTNASSTTANREVIAERLARATIENRRIPLTQPMRHLAQLESDKTQLATCSDEVFAKIYPNFLAGYSYFPSHYTNDLGKMRKMMLDMYDAKISLLKLQILNARPGKTIYDPVAAYDQTKKSVFDYANTNFDDLPSYNREMEMNFARSRLNEWATSGVTFTVASASSTRLRQMAMESLGWTANKATEEVASEYGGRVLSRQIDTLKKILPHLTAPGVQKSAGRTSLNAAWEIIKKLGKKAPLVGGGYVTLSAAVAGEVLNVTPTACQEIQHRFINLDEKCNPIYEVNDTVIKALLNRQNFSLAMHQQPGLCEYYTKLHQKLFKQPRFEKLECKKDRFVLSVRESSGQAQTYTVSYNNGTQQIRQINGKHGNLLEVRNDGTIKNASGPGVAQLVVPMKLYMTDAYECCNASDPHERTSCLATYNGTSDDDAHSVSQ